MKQIFKKYKAIFSMAFKGFSNDKANKLSGSLAYRTIFSLPPVLLLVILSAGYFYGQAAVQGQIFDKLNGVIGSGSAEQIQNIIKNLSLSKNSILATVIGIVALVVGATTLFTEIQSSLNQIMGVRPSSKKGIINLLINRGISFLMIIGMGLLLIASLLANAVILTMGHWLTERFEWLPLQAINLLNYAFLLLVLFFFFAFVFKVLPDVKIKWRQVWPASILTTILFLLGKYGIGLYISSSTMISAYGAASSIIILMAWVYFSAMIVYFGAEFARAWLRYKEIPLIPSPHAEKTEKGKWDAYQKEQNIKAHREDESASSP